MLNASGESAQSRRNSCSIYAVAVRNLGRNTQYVQVTYLLASDETIAREFGAYDNIRDNFPKYVLSLDEFDMSRNGIKHQNIRDFLLMDKWY